MKDEKKLSKNGKRNGRPPARRKGRPKGDASIMHEYKMRMLNSPRSKEVLNAIIRAALDDEHKNQSAAWKIVMDRVAPIAMFEEEVLKNGGKSNIQINISGIGQPDVGKVIDGEVVDA